MYRQIKSEKCLILHLKKNPHKFEGAYRKKNVGKYERIEV